MRDVEVEVLWPALCVAHQALSRRHTCLLAMLMSAAMPLSQQELAHVSGEPPAALDSLCSLLHDLRLVWRTPQGLAYVLPSVRDAIRKHVARRLKFRLASSTLV